MRGVVDEPVTLYTRQPVDLPADWIRVRAGDPEFTRRLRAATEERTEIIAPRLIAGSRCARTVRTSLFMPPAIVAAIARELEHDRAERAAYAAGTTARRLLRELYPSAPGEHYARLQATIAAAVAQPIRKPGARRAPKPWTLDILHAAARTAVEQYIATTITTTVPPPGQIELFDLGEARERSLTPDEISALLAAWARPPVPPPPKRPGRGARPRPKTETTDETNTQVVRFADVDIAACARGLERPVAVWYALRALDPHGEGRVPVAALPAVAHTLGISRATLRRALWTGDGIVWHRLPGYLYLHAPARVAAALGVAHIRAAWRAPIAVLRVPLGALRARLHIQAVAAVRRERRTSVAAMAAMANVSTRTTRRRLNRAGVRRYANLRLVAPISSRSAVPALARALRVSNLAATWYKNHVWLIAQIPNSLATPSPSATRGTGSIRRRVNRRLRTPSASGRGSVLIAGTRAQRTPIARDGRLVAVAVRRRGTLLWRIDHPDIQRVTFLIASHAA